MYLLIDTNIFITSITNFREEHLIDQLEKLVDMRLIEILVPETLLEEWNKKKMQTIDHYKKTSIEFARLAAGNENYVIDVEEQVRKKSERIDKLLSDPVKIKLSKKTKLYTTNQSLAYKAPFHTGKTNLKDALIYFSTLEYLKSKRIKEYVFITNNGTDFGDNGNKSKGLHPDLIKKEIKCNYFSALGQFFHAYKGEFNVHFEKIRNDFSPSKPIVLVSQQKLNLLEYLYKVLRICESKIAFMPLEILPRIAPFRVKESQHNYTSYDGFALYTNNKELVSLFEEYDILRRKFRKQSKYKNSVVNLKYIKYILEYLNRHYVFALSLTGTSKGANINAGPAEIKVDSHFCFNNLMWKELWKSLQKKTSSLSKAHVLFQLGFYTKSFQEYYLFYKKAVENKNLLLKFALLRNLKNVANFIFADNADEIETELSEIKEINIENEYFHFTQKSKLEFEIATFYRNGADLQYYETEIRNALKEIEDHYESQLRGGISSGSYYYPLLNQFAIFERYTEINVWTYSRYSEFTKICSDFCKGVFLSYAVNDYQPGRLSYFDDTTLEILTLYGNADQMLIWFNRYVKKQIVYRPSGENFISILNNHFSVNAGFIEKILSTNTWEVSSKFYMITWNLLLLLSIVEVDSKHIKVVFTKVYNLLKIMPDREKIYLSHLASFIQDKGQYANKKDLNKIFNLIVDRPVFHNDELFNAFARLANKHPVKLIYSYSSFEKILAFVFSKCEKCGRRHSFGMLSFYSLMTSSLQKKFTDKIDENLDKGTDLELFISGSMSNLANTSKYLHKYLPLFDKPLKPNPRFLSMEITMRSLNNFLNVIFKFDLPLPIEFVTKMKGLSDYYDWLLDMDGFNYDKFNPLWIIQYPTASYLKKAFSIRSVRKQVRTFLGENYQPLLAKYYADNVD